MALPVYIEDPDDKTRAGVTVDHSLRVSLVHTRPSELSNEILTARKEFRDYFKTTAGSNAMNVAGTSAAPVSFLIPASPVKQTRVIERVRFVINGANFDISSADARRFGSATALNTPLTNGITFQVIQSEVTTDIFIDPVVITGDFLNYNDSLVNYPDAISISVDFLSFDFVLRGPVVLPGGTRDRIVINVRDDLTPVTLFRAIGIGTQDTT